MKVYFELQNASVLVPSLRYGCLLCGRVWKGKDGSKERESAIGGLCLVVNGAERVFQYSVWN